MFATGHLPGGDHLTEEKGRGKEEERRTGRSFRNGDIYFFIHPPPPPPPKKKEKQRERTLQRRRSRLQLEPGNRQSTDFSENAEFDELISLLKTGDFLAQRRSRQSSGSNIRTLEISRERPSSVLLDSSDA